MIKLSATAVGTTLAACTLVGCGTTIGFMQTNAPPHALAARAPASVEVLPQGTQPSRAYAIYGIFETHPDSAYSDTRLTPKLTAKLRNEAARTGCDALLMEGATPVAAPTLGGDAEASAGYRAACVVYTAAQAAR